MLLHCTLGKLIFSFQRFESCFLWYVCGSEKSRFLELSEDVYLEMCIILRMLEVTTIGSHAGSQVLTQHLHSHLVGRCNLSPYIERNVKLENNIREKELFNALMTPLIILLIRRCS